MPKEILVLVDGSSYLHRAYHALPTLTNSQGEATGAIYGVINMIRKLLTDFDPEYVAIVFDAKGKTFRHHMFAQYKATRPAMPTELVNQIQPLHQTIKAMGLPLIMLEGVEADDIIGTLAKQAALQQIPTIIATGDKDMAQLVNEHITLINTMTNTALDTAEVTAKFGIPPHTIVDYLALVGDSSDNIPGVPTIGPKTAVKFLTAYGSLDNLIAHAHEIKGKIGENLLQSQNYLPLTRALLTIKDDVPLTFELHDLKRQPPNNQELICLFKRLEFNSWLKPLLGEQQPQITELENFQAILEQKTFHAWLEKLRNAPAFAIDLETTSLDTIQAEIVGLSFAITKFNAIYIPVAHDYSGAPPQLDRNYVLEQLKPILTNPSIIKLGQNLKYDIGVLSNYGIELQGIGFDTMLESYVLNSGTNQHNKEILALKHLGKNVISAADLAGESSKNVAFNKIPLEKAMPYAANDASLVLELHEALWPRIEHTPKLPDVFKNIEMPLVSVLSRMERQGVCVDVTLLKQQSLDLAKRLATIEHEVYQLAGATFNLNSPLQLQEILFNKLKLPVLRKTLKGQISTAEAVLQELALDYELPKLILAYRSLSKLKSTYTDALPAQINTKTNRIHTSYNQAVTITGRLSSTNPNLQNIPARTAEGRKIRQAFIAPPQYQIVAADYSQIELRILAHLSEDPGLLQAFANNGDVHKATAADIFGVTINNVTQLQRQQAKTINFGLIYGMSAFGLAKHLNLPREAAQKYMDLYFTRFAKVKTYMETARMLAQKQGYVATIFGRRLYTPDINSKNMMRRNAAERAAINAPMQGSAADIIKIAMINIDRFIRENNFDIKMIMQVHDELVFEISTADVNAAISHIKQIMQNAVALAVPLIVDCGVAQNWEAAH
jgi:DNA polymerase I